MIQKSLSLFFFYCSFLNREFCDSDSVLNFVSRQRQFSITKLKIKDSDSHNFNFLFTLLAEFPQL